LAGKQLIDGLCAGIAWLIADQLWFVRDWNALRMLVWILMATVVGSAFRLTSLLYRLAGIRDAIRLGWATLVLLLCALGFEVLRVPLQLSPDVSHIAFIAAVLTGLFWGTVRVGCRVWQEHQSQQRLKGDKQLNRTLIIGAGRAGSLVMQELTLHPNLGYQVVGFVDDAPQKKGLSIQGIRVLGDSTRLAALVAKHAVTHAILAIPSATGREIRELNETLLGLDVQVKTVPGIFNLLGTQLWKPVIRNVSIEDVLRRDPIQLDQSALSETMEGSTVLITGAGGSIGSELARQVAAFKPGQVVLLGRGENSLWTIQREFQTLFPDRLFALELMDIRNRNGLREVFERYKPKVVLHAAAHKHVPFLETHPLEAVLNNIFGTLNVVEAALDFGTQVLVNISTDKAVNPTNVLGASKRIAEHLVLDASRKAAPGCRFVSVRFGNVLGSRGSVVPIFRDQIRKGGPITVTHPEMTRYFMTIPEASQLVLQAGLLGDNGKVYVLDMGEPVKILDLAADMARFSGLEPGKDIEVLFVGLRPGEKLHEELFLDQERVSTKVHPKVFEANPKGLEAEVLGEGLASFRRAAELPYEKRQPEIVRLLKEMVPTYTPSLLGVGKYGGHVRDRRTQSLRLPENVACRRNGSR
jgi:FlaA1/EpsC-like NDP-sugar epimerase